MVLGAEVACLVKPLLARADANGLVNALAGGTAEAPCAVAWLELWLWDGCNATVPHYFGFLARYLGFPAIMCDRATAVFVFCLTVRPRSWFGREDDGGLRLPCFF